MKQALSLFMALAILLFATGCTESASPPTSQQPAEKVQLVVFAAASLTDTLTEVEALYRDVAPHVSLLFNFDSSGTLKTQIEQGADCDIFISAAQKQMDQLDSGSGNTVDTDSADYILSSTRFDLVGNSVVLIVPQGNPAGISGFEDLLAVQPLTAVGNADVPVGQYTEEIFRYLGIWEELGAAGKLTFGTNVKEVLSQVAAAAVDCGVVYSTDAATTSAVEIVAYAPAGSHASITYPAAVLSGARHRDEAEAFLRFLATDACSAIFESAGFVAAH